MGYLIGDSTGGDPAVTFLGEQAEGRMSASATMFTAAAVDTTLIFEVLRHKGLISHLDMIEGVARLREALPPDEPYSRILDMLERKYAPGHTGTFMWSPHTE